MTAYASKTVVGGRDRWWQPVLPANSQLALQSPQAGTTPAFLVQALAQVLALALSSRVLAQAKFELLY